MSDKITLILLFNKDIICKETLFISEWCTYFSISSIIKNFLSPLLFFLTPRKKETTFSTEYKKIPEGIFAFLTASYLKINSFLLLSKETKSKLKYL